MNTIRKCEILLPKVDDNQKWAVVSCDQFTSERKYWSKLKSFVDGTPSALNLIFPEVYLEDGDDENRIKQINATMETYLKDGVFSSLNDSFILVKRTTESGVSRLGLIVSVDLDDYSYQFPSDATIRSTEGVVLDRIPPRLKIRSNAPIELPHIMLLIDDRNKSIIEPLYQNHQQLDLLYDFDLNMNGGHLTGYRVDAEKVIKLFDNYQEGLSEMYGKPTNFVFAVGDGNHSLATAKAHWDKIKGGLSAEERETHPARFALCEVENLHDDGIVFEPIHRFVFNADFEEFVNFAKQKLSGSAKVLFFDVNNKLELNVNINSAKAIADIQEVVDEFNKTHKNAYVDYIHGIQHLTDIAKENRGVAIAMPKIGKTDLFAYVMENGPLCRKAFSMGEAEEKRYYFEAKKII